MGHHGGRYGPGGYGYSHGPGPILETLRRMPRSLKIFLALVILFLLLAGLALVALVVLLFSKLVAGGTLPGYLQDALDLALRYLQPLLDLWKSALSLAGKN
jgi:hypothetical protein